MSTQTLEKYCINCAHYFKTQFIEEYYCELGYRDPLISGGCDEWEKKVE